MSEGHCRLPKCECVEVVSNSLRPTGCSNWVRPMISPTQDDLIERLEKLAPLIMQAPYSMNSADLMKEAAAELRSLRTRVIELETELANRDAEGA